jgi:hypothetical protein
VIISSIVHFVGVFISVMYKHILVRTKIRLFNTNVKSVLLHIPRDAYACAPYVYVKYPLFLSDFSAIRIFSTDFRKILKYQIS